jgi:N-acyl-D-amino-acid deacylase
MYDLKIAGGTIIDGSGAARYAGDVGIHDGKIVALGEAPDAAKRTINADGRVVSPGFVDIHTHYDAQVFWDPLLTVSPWHGVTTAVMGNCGFTLAPTRKEHRDLILRTFERVEAISLAALRETLGDEWPFATYPEYLDAVERRGLGINAASFIGHTAVRLNVMGIDSVERAATGPEIAAMRALVVDGLKAGAIGFSTSIAKAHHGFDGKPVPSRLSTREERVALAGAIRDAGNGMVMMVGPTDPRPWDEYIELAHASGSAVCWTIIQGTPGRYPAELALTRELVRAGLRIYPQAACRPVLFEYHFGEPVGIMATWPLLGPILRMNTVEEKLATLRDAHFRSRFRDAIDGRNDADLGGTSEEASMRRRGFLLTEIAWYPPGRALESRRAVDVAKERGLHPVDLVLDMSVETRLEARFRTPQQNFDEEHLGAVLADPNVVLGLGDGGAHLAQLCDAVYATHFLKRWVRERKLVTLEHAIHRLTAHTASVFGITDRGRLAVGWPADVVVFDPETVGNLPLERVYDLPAGSERMVSRSQGIDAVIVNGAMLPPQGERFEKGERLPGKLLRHGSAS